MSNCSERRRQRGDMLIESLIGVLLLSSLGAGLAGVAARVLGAQHEARVAELAVGEMRRMLQREGEALCAGDPTREVTLGGADGLKNVTIAVACDAPPVVTVSALGAPDIHVPVPAPVRLSVAPSALGLADDGPAITVGTRQ